MKITWKPRAAGTENAVVLGDNTVSRRGPGSKLILRFVPVAQSQAQVAAYPGADTVEVFGRQNVQTAAPVTVLYEFRSYGETTKFACGLGEFLFQEGVLEVAHQGGGASVMQAVCTAAEPLELYGCTLVVAYQFTGGRFNKGQSPTGVGDSTP